MHIAPETLIAHKSRRRTLTRLRALPHRYKNVVLACGTVPEVSSALYAVVQRLRSDRDPVPLLETLAESIDFLAEVLCLDIYAELAPDLLTVIDTSKAVARSQMRLSSGSREILACGPRMTSRLVARWLEENGIGARWVECGFLGVPKNMGYLKLTTRWGRALKRQFGSGIPLLVTQSRIEPKREPDLVPSC